MKANIQLSIQNNQTDHPVTNSYQFPMGGEKLERLHQELRLPHEVDRTFFDYAVKSPQWLEDAIGSASINLMELDYLAKRLDSFDKREMNTYIAVIEKEGLHNMTDLINMTFHSNQYTLITDVSSLAEVGQTRYMSQHGGISLAQLDTEYDRFYRLGKELMTSGTGTPTDRGILFPPENKEPMQSLYREGGMFPTYDWKGDPSMEVDITTMQKAEQGESPVTVRLPMSQLQQNDILLRMGTKHPSEMVLVFVDAGELTEVVDFTDVSLYDLNALAKALQKVEPENYETVAQIAELSGGSSDIYHITGIADHLEDIIHVPNVFSAEEYGHWLIEESGKFDSARTLQYDGLDDFLNFEKLGEHYVSMENGVFAQHGYFGVGDPGLAFILEQPEEMEQTEPTTEMEMQ